MNELNTVENKRSPIYPEQEYIWYCKKNNNSYIYEYDNDKHETMFDYLDKANIVEFGLLGNGITFSFDVDSGIFYINDKALDMDLYIGAKEIKPIGAKDIIEYKMAHTDGIMQGGRLKRYVRNIDGYFVGYKMSLDNGVYYQANIGIPVTGNDRRPFIGFKISAPKKSTFKAIIKNQNNNTGSIELEPNRSNYLNLYF